MAILTRHSVPHTSLALGAAAILPRPYVANAAATTIDVLAGPGFDAIFAKYQIQA